MTHTYPLSRYRFEFLATSCLRLPEYAGSTLRGAFGHALRQLGCMTREKSCAGCMLAANCPYTAIFEPQKSTTATLTLATPPVPYIIEPPEWGARLYVKGETLVFYFTLVGHASNHLPLCIMAWIRAFARGIGAGDGTAELISVAQESQSGAFSSVSATNHELIYQPGGTVREHSHLLALPDQTAPASVTLHFVTPLRLQENGHAIPPKRLTPRPLLTALARRASLLSEQYHGNPLFSAVQFSELARVADTIEGQVQMEWRDWTRRSARQQCTMQLGGCMGTWVFSGDLALFWDVLRIGQLLHVGKEASFGLGQYRISTENAN